MENARRLFTCLIPVALAEPEHPHRHVDLKACPGSEIPGLLYRYAGEAEDLAGEEEPKATALSGPPQEDLLLFLSFDAHTVVLVDDRQPVFVLLVIQPDRRDLPAIPQEIFQQSSPLIFLTARWLPL